MKQPPFISESQIKKARVADPNDGRCFLTGRAAAIETCHLLAQATDDKELTQLEYAWGLGWQQLNVDDYRNFLFLRIDWRILFESNQWMLIPEESVLSSMLKLRKEAEPPSLAEFFGSKKKFKYHLLPMKGMEEPICRYEANDSHTTFYYPFVELGVLTSHVQPHYVVANVAKKLKKLEYPTIVHLSRVLHQIATRSADPSSQEDPRIHMMALLYDAWMTAKLPDTFLTPTRPSKRRKPQLAQRDKRDEGKRQEKRAYADYDEDSDTTVDSTMIDEWDSSEETAWIEKISEWAHKGFDEAKSAGGWESAVLNDDQVRKYKEELAPAPPVVDDWHDWEPSWLDVDESDIDKSKFSSNDWSAFMEDILLTA